MSEVQRQGISRRAFLRVAGTLGISASLSATNLAGLVVGVALMYATGLLVAV